MLDVHEDPSSAPGVQVYFRAGPGLAELPITLTL